MDGFDGVINGFFLVVLLGVGIAGGVFVRKWIKDWSSQEDDINGPGFTLGDLRQLHASGKLSDAEFASAKAVLLQSLGAGKK